MKIALLAMGQIAPNILSDVSRTLTAIFPDTTSTVSQEVLAVPQQAFNKERNQYNSTQILNHIQTFAHNHGEFQRVLGIADVDVYASGLNYVFGEAYISGRVGLISLWRLRPEFYGEEPDSGALKLRILKEAVHELGHTLGLQHCTHSYCVMHFSNSIFEVDKKQSLFCDQCYLTASLTINRMDQQT
ncbi:MAG: archaemetzincin family Zn-dependent metalloprotease [Candidatus Bathyarchaeota archaeon]|nr:archaemetzincin family Zn-dependent metalloprotease [Candidatus Bathyarchaeota archaeon]